MKKNKFSIIIPHLNEWYYLDIMLDSFYNYIKYNNYEIVIVDDGSDDLLSLDFLDTHPLKNKIKLYKENWLWISNNRNFGASKANWDFLFFMDSHMYIYEDILTKINSLLNTNKYIKIFQINVKSMNNKNVHSNLLKLSDYSLDWTYDIPKTKTKNSIHKIPSMPWHCIIIKTNIFNKIGCFDKFLINYWMEDIWISFKAYLRGYKCYKIDTINIIHRYRSTFTNYTVLSKDVLYNKIIFALTYFHNEIRLKKTLAHLKKEYSDFFESTYNDIISNQEFINRKQKEQNKFKYDDDWYFNRFKIYFNDQI